LLVVCLMCLQHVLSHPGSGIHWASSHCEWRDVGSPISPSPYQQKQRLYPSECSTWITQQGPGGPTAQWLCKLLQRLTTQLGLCGMSKPVGGPCNSPWAPQHCFHTPILQEHCTECWWSAPWDVHLTCLTTVSNWQQNTVQGMDPLTLTGFPYPHWLLKSHHLHLGFNLSSCKLRCLLLISLALHCNKTCWMGRTPLPLQERWSYNACNKIPTLAWSQYWCAES
jgi:hypothetical protein